MLTKLSRAERCGPRRGAWLENSAWLPCVPSVYRVSHGKGRVKRPARYFPNSDLQQLTQVLVTRRRTVLVFVARTNTFSVRGASDDSRQLEPGDSAESAGARRREHMADFSTKSLASDGQKKTARGCSPADAESARPSTAPLRVVAFTLGRGARQPGRRMPGARPISDAAARTWAENEERKRAAVRDGPEKENVKVGFVGGKAGEKDDTRNLRVDSLIRFSFGPRTTGSGSARLGSLVFSNQFGFQFPPFLVQQHFRFTGNRNSRLPSPRYAHNFLVLMLV
jgi:hypothetical protein